MISFPNAKINIGLNVVNRRSDGFHSIESIFYPIPLNDVLEIKKSTSFSFQVDGLSIPSNSSGQNLVEQAYLLLKKDFGIDPVKMILLKNIPIGAGLGGGSSDAAFALKMLNDFFELGLSMEKLENYSSFLGSDCPFFIRNRTSYVSGRGEILEPNGLDLTGKFMVLVKPDIYISTKEAYEGVRPISSKFDLKLAKNLDMQAWKMYIKNDFEEHLFLKYPSLKNVKEELYLEGAIYASMSGSGSCIYGIFENEIPFIEPIPNAQMFKLAL